MSEQERHRQSRRRGSHHERARQALPGFLRADRGCHRMLTEQDPRRVSADIGEGDTEHQAENLLCAVVRIDQQRTEGCEQRNPCGHENRDRHIAQIILRLTAQPLAQEPPNHAHHDGRGEGTNRSRGPPGPRQPDHGLPAEEQRDERNRDIGLAQPLGHLPHRDPEEDRDDADPDLLLVQQRENDQGGERNPDANCGR
ncbi:Uncharacterised protein [Mycobacteroides abscessus subsp. massiliense]|nr:Uncharacterised protein [Mycobacteroides abscessus subsp. massiliense]